MRWKGIITFVVFVAITLVISIVFIDRWIESGLEKTGQAIVGARVDIDGLDVGFSPLSIEWQRLQVTDPDRTMKNMVETGRTAFRLNVPAILRKRIVIEEITLADIRSGTDRAYDGVLPKKKPKTKKQPEIFDKIKRKLNHQIDQLPLMQFDLSQVKRKMNLDSLFALVDLKMVDRIDSLKADINQTSKKWNDFYQSFKPEEDLKSIRAEFASIEPEKIKTMSELYTALKKVQSAQKKLNRISETVQTKHKEIKTDFNRFSNYGNAVSGWYREDYQKVLEKAKLPDLSVTHIGNILFGGTVVHQVNKYLGIVQKARDFIPKKSAKPKKAKPSRMVGQTIHFQDRHQWPSFLIQKVHLSGQTGSTEEQPGLMLQGEARGITSQPWIYGNPTLVDLVGKKADQRAVVLNAHLDHTTEIAKDRFQIRFQNVSLNNVTIHKSDYLPSTIKKGKADIDCVVQFEEETYTIRFDVISRGLTFDFSNLRSANPFEKIVRDIIQRMDVITLRTTIRGKGDDLTLKMDSNIDERISQELKKMGSKALTDARNRIKARVQKTRQEKEKELEQLYQGKRGQIEGVIEKYEEEVETQKMVVLGKIEKIQKNIEAKKEKEEDKLKDRAKDILDDILK
jgi:uncharacterized protein (TIGR03545 family)